MGLASPPNFILEPVQNALATANAAFNQSTSGIKVLGRWDFAEIKRHSYAFYGIYVSVG